MKLMSYLFLTAITLLSWHGSSGQNYNYVESALLFGSTKPGGSARIQALGGTQISLGGDYSSAFSNPAGLGMYNRSEFALTPGVTGFSNSATYNGAKTTETLSRLNIPGFGAVFHIESGKQDSKFVGGSFGVTFNRINDFNGGFNYEGLNDRSSIIESFIAAANGTNTSQFDPGSTTDPPGYNYNSPVGLAYFNYIIGPASTLDPDFPDDEYFTDVQSNFEDITTPALQREMVANEGSTNQWSISYGANFSDRIFIGGGFGITTLRYKSEQIFDESYSFGDPADDDPNFYGLVLNETLNIRGSGINATIGAIFRPVEFVQLGFAYTTPTLYEMTETYRAEMSSNWKNFDYYGDGETILNDESASTDDVTSEYTFTVPSKASFGATFIAKFGFISADIEYRNLSNLKYKSDITGISFSQENNEIKSSYTSVLNYRLGAEYRINIFRVRAGGSMMGSPYADDATKNVFSYSGGVGVRLDKFYIDFALVRRINEGKYSPYGGDLRPVIDLDGKMTTGMITVGFTY